MSSTIPQMSWRSNAAYLYILELDAPALSWEYLRRNPQYRREWEQPLQHDPRAWHCRDFANPCHDSRTVQPDWVPTAACILRLTGCDESNSPTRFSLWRFPGHKTFSTNGQNHLLTVRAGAQTWRLSLSPQVKDNGSFSFQIPAGLDPVAPSRLIGRINALMSSYRRNKPIPCGTSGRPSRDAVLHMRILQALDAGAAGASHREIAETLFGVTDVWQRWSKDGELRSYVRYLLRRGRGLVNGGYYRLLMHS